MSELSENAKYPANNKNDVLQFDIKLENLWNDMKFSRQQPSDMHALRAYLYDSFGWRYRGKSVPPPGLHLLSATNMIHSASQLWQCDGHLSGEGFRGMHFDIHEVFARKVDGALGPMEVGRDFSGLLIALRHRTSFMSRTIVKHDRGPLNPRAIDGMKRVGLVDSVFESRFEVYSDDQVESRALLTPDFMERLLQMDSHPRYSNMQLGFISGRVYLALPIRDVVRFGCDRQSISPEQAASNVMGEMQTVFEILGDVDELQASAGYRASDKDVQSGRREWYNERVSRVEAHVETAVKNGILSGKPIPAWMTAEAYDWVDPRLHGMLRPIFWGSDD